MTDALAPTAGSFPASSHRPAASAQRFALASWFVALSESDPASLRYLLLLRFALLNLVGIALVAAVWAHGWLDDMIATDRYHLVKLNVGVFLVGLAMCGNRILKLSQDLNSRGIVPGEYTVNLHLYRNTAGVFPIPVTVVTSVKKSAKESAHQLLASNIELTHEGEELTVFRFKLSEGGDLVSGSVHSLQRKLRSWRSS
jgi:hypothetical protein